MGRIRTIKPEFPQSETIGKLSREARLLFIMLWTIADDAGRFRAASRMLASILYPYDDDASAAICGWLDELERNDCIRRYEVNGSTFGEIVNWLSHQKIDRPGPSRLPAFDEGSRALASVREASTTDLGPSTLDPGPLDHGPDAAARERGVALPGAVVGTLIGPALFKMFCDAYPPDAFGDRVAARGAFDERAKAGSDVVDKIIADARLLPRTGGIQSAAAWLDAWAEKPQPTPLVSSEAIELANRLCVIAGHDITFPPPAWMGAAYRIQHWLNQGWAEGIITASVTQQVARKRGSKIQRVEYFEPGIADAVARANARLPTGNATNSRSGDSREDHRQKHSAVAAIDRVFSKLRERSGDSGSVGGPDEDAVLRLSARPVR